jgi:subtilisin-like proprotein convertase family protein
LTCTGIRDHDWAARQNNTPTTPANFTQVCPSGPGGPCGREPHCESYPISETIYDLATRDLPAAGLDPDTAWQLAERLWYVTRPGSGGDVFNCFRTHLAHSCFATHWMQRMLVVDDDDGDLSNGTPHAAAIYAAFDRHGISCGSAGDPENQSTSSCPSIGAPSLTLVETSFGTELSWAAIAGAGEIRVYRNELGCNRQQVPIAALAGSATTYVDDVADPELPRYYRVEAIGVNAACHSPVSNCETTPQSARLQQLSYRVVESGPDVNGFPDPGETVTLPVTLFNSGLDASSGTTGQLLLVDPSQGTVTRLDATWNDIVANGTNESAAPHFELMVADSVMCGEILELETEVSAANAVAARRRFDIQLGDRSRDFVNDVALPIPPETTEPVTSTIVIDQDQTIAELDVSVDIRHNLATELIVELSSPGGTTVRLHDRTDGTTGSVLRARYDLDRDPDGPGTMQDFAGETTLGTWTLSVEDVGPDSTSDSSLASWTLHLDVTGGFDCVGQPCTEPPPSDSVSGVTVELDPAGTDLDFNWNAVVPAAGYHVLWSTDPSFGAGVTLGGATSGETRYTMVDGVGSTPDLTFFQLRVVNGCGEEGP